MDLEQRLRSELERSSRNTAMSPAPPVTELTAVANKRHQRNRVLGAAGVIVVVGVIGVGALLSAGGGESSLEVASANNDSAAATATAATQPEVDAEPEEAASIEEELASEESALEQGAEDTSGEQADDASTSPESTTEEPNTSETVIEIAGVSRSLQADQSSVEVEQRSSAVELAAGSGVLVVSNGSGGYGGLATRFGSEASAIGLSSANGLDWTEVELSGIPEGATASQLTDYDGTFVALFESFGPAGRSTSVGTSTDLASWDVSEPLGGEPFATGLAVGSAGVIVVGDNESPDVWVGPIGGPYERSARLAATVISGVTTLGDEFLIAGRSSEGATLFRSTNGVDWTGTALSAPAIPGSAPVVSVDRGTIILSDVATSVSLISTDGGATWNQLSADSDGVVVSSSTLGVLSSSNGGAAVAIADGDSFGVAQIDVEAPDRLSLIAAGDDEIVLLQATETGARWIVASR